MSNVRVEPATRGHVDDAIGGLRGEVQDGFRAVRGEMRAMEGRLRGEMAGMEKRMLWEIGHAINAAVEQFVGAIRLVDEKYAALPGRVSALERRFDD